MDKRKTSMLIPWLREKDSIKVYLQKRSINARRNPGGLSVFGGGLEGDENYIDALKREIKEELNYLPKNFTEVGTFEDEYSISKYYAEEVSDNFEDSISLGEGEYGMWVDTGELFKRENISQNTKKVMEKLLDIIG